MVEELEGKLDPRIKAVWRISDALWVSIVFAIAIVPGLIALSSGFDGAGLYCGVVAAVYAALLLLFLVVITPLRYLRWRYHLEPGFLRIVRHFLAHHHRGSLHPRSEHRHEAGAHPASLRFGERDGVHCRRCR